MKIDASELNALAVDLGKGAAKTVPLASAAVVKTAYNIESTSKIFAPVDTGNLRNGISTTIKGLRAEIGPTAEYAPFVEDGTSVNAPQAFMGPAYDRHAHELVDALARIAGGVLE